MKKNSLAYLVCLLLYLLPVASMAALVVKTELISGKIVQLYSDRSVRLDNNMVYKPSRKDLKIDLNKGDVVTLRYYMETSGNKVFFEYVSGTGGLAPLPPYSPASFDKQPK